VRYAAFEADSADFKGGPMAEVTVTTTKGEMPMFVARPTGGGPWPGVVVIHDAIGMSRDVRNQAEWLAGEGFIAVAPDLYYWGTRRRCFFTFMRDETKPMGDIDAARQWLLEQSECTSKVGIIGYCMGGGFALAMAPNHGFDASSVNYGRLSKATQGALGDACPIVASYGAKDFFTKNIPGRLETALTAAGVEHDIKVYPDVAHGFLNDHDPAEVGWAFTLMSKLSRSYYDESAATDARLRIAGFFNTHLRN